VSIRPKRWKQAVLFHMHKTKLPCKISFVKFNKKMFLGKKKRLYPRILLKLLVQKWVVMAEWIGLAYFMSKIGFCDKQILLSILKIK
jgi:hypothetical protein